MNEEEWKAKIESVMQAYSIGMKEYEDEGGHVEEIESLINIGNDDCYIPLSEIKNIWEKAQQEIKKRLDDRPKNISLALSEMRGFKIGKWDDIVTLVISSGLTKKEWEYIKEYEDCGHLDEDDIQKIDEYFRVQK